MCVARSLDVPLAVALEVAHGDGDGVPVVLDPFVLEGPTARTWTLPAQVEISGEVRDAHGPLDAEVRFVPARLLRGTAGAAIVVTTMDADPPGHYAARLPAGQEYRMEVHPVALELPPFRRDLRATGNERIDVDYGEVELEERVFDVQGGPEGAGLLVRAVRLVGDAVVSSTGRVDRGRAALWFPSDSGDVRIEVSVEEPYQDLASRTAGSKGCDTSAPSYPTFSIADADVPRKHGVSMIELPPYPTRIAFSGTVDLCPGAHAPRDEVTQLPVALRSTAVLTEGETQAFSGTFGATTNAQFDDGQLRFCVEVVPGTYEVVVTPPAGVECAIFAETRLVSAPEGEDATGVLFVLPAPAHLTGALQAPDGMAIPGATIEAQALGRREGVQLAEGDASVTGYNRSHQTTSGEDGTFELPVDLGGYDVIVKPPAESGFPWRTLHDVNIGARDVDFRNVIDVTSPVRIDGRLRVDGDGSVAGAEVRAYAVIDDAYDTERAVPVGKVTVDAEGRFTLLLSPSTQEGW